MRYDASNLLVPGVREAGEEVLVEVDPDRAGWEFIHFQARRLAAGSSWSFDTAESEFALVVLGGSLDVDSSRGAYPEMGKRANVFEGPPDALYLPRRTTLTVTARTDVEFAATWVETDRDDVPRRIRPADVTIEVRGGDNATRQINNVIPPGFPCRRLVVVEAYTPSGGWSSYPPHKHDIHLVGPDGALLEADLEEVYFYKIDREEGYAYQRVYTDPESPLHRAGKPIDAVVVARTNDVVLVPEGYHPVVSPPGYTTYYLNVLAGSAQSLANRDDPRYTWVKDSYGTRNPAVPIYEAVAP